jgi:hypothetical protein
MRETYDIGKSWYSEKEAEQYTSLSRTSLMEARKTGKLTYRLMNSKIIYHREHLDKFIERNTMLCESSDDLRSRQRGRR